MIVNSLCFVSVRVESGILCFLSIYFAELHWSLNHLPVLINLKVSDDNVIQCFLLGEAVLENATGDDGKLASKLSVQLNEGKAAYFKALAAGNAEKEATALCCLERCV